MHGMNNRKFSRLLQLLLPKYVYCNCGGVRQQLIAVTTLRPDFTFCMILYAFFVWSWHLQNCKKATVNCTIPNHLFAQNSAASTLILLKFYIKSARKIQVWLKLHKSIMHYA